MEHIVYVDYKTKELNKIISGIKTRIIRGATGRKLPYGKIETGDTLYFINNNGENLIKANANVTNVSYSDKLTKEESIKLVKNNQNKLQLEDKLFNKWAGKRYITLIEINNVKEIQPFSIDKSEYKNMDDWIIIEDIKKISVDK